MPRIERKKGINKFITDKVINMEAMFQNCDELEKLDLSSFDTSNVNEIKHMFSFCYKLKEIKGINNFNTKNVEDMDGLFAYCKKLKYLDLSNFNTSKVNNMNWMFYQCIELREIKGLKNFNTIKLEGMHAMFCQCDLLESLDLSSFNTSNENKNGMFILWML